MPSATRHIARIISTMILPSTVMSTVDSDAINEVLSVDYSFSVEQLKIFEGDFLQPTSHAKVKSVNHSIKRKSRIK